MVVIYRNLHHFLNLFFGNLDSSQILFQNILKSEKDNILEFTTTRLKVRVAVRGFRGILSCVFNFC